MNENLKKLKRNAGYGFVIVGLRESGVIRNNPGYEIVALATTEKLIKPELKLDDLLNFLEKNQGFEGIFKKLTKEEIFELMKSALYNVYTKHSFKVEDDGIVEKFITNLSSEIRLRTLMKIYVEENEIEVSRQEQDICIDVLMRRFNKPDEEFLKVMYRMAGRYDIDDIEKLKELLLKVFCRSEEGTEKELVEKIDKFLKNKDNIIF